MLAVGSLSIFSTRLLFGGLILISSSGCPNSHPTKPSAVALPVSAPSSAPTPSDSSLVPPELRAYPPIQPHEAADERASHAVTSHEQEATIAAILELRQQRGSILADSELDDRPARESRSHSEHQQASDQHTDFAAALRSFSERHSSIGQDPLRVRSMPTSLAPLQPRSTSDSDAQDPAQDSAASAATQVSPTRRPRVAAAAAPTAADANLSAVVGSDLDSSAKPLPDSARPDSDLSLIQALRHTARQLREAAWKSPASGSSRSAGRQARYQALAELLEAEISSLPQSADSAPLPANELLSPTSTPTP
jgi:hypothetical protein